MGRLIDLAVITVVAWAVVTEAVNGDWVAVGMLFVVGFGYLVGVRADDWRRERAQRGEQT